jgi:hypothetical protein
MSEITEQATVSGPVDLTYREPSGWSSVPEHCATRAQAERLRDATNSLSGRSAATRRTWQIQPCACREGGNR